MPVGVGDGVGDGVAALTNATRRVPAGTTRVPSAAPKPVSSSRYQASGGLIDAPTLPDQRSVPVAASKPYRFPLLEPAYTTPFTITGAVTRPPSPVKVHAEAGKYRECYLPAPAASRFRPARVQSSSFVT